MRTWKLEVLVLVSLVAAALNVNANGQTAPLEQFDARINIDSGPVVNRGAGRDVVFATVVNVPEATWLRLSFDHVTLGSPPTDGQETVIRLTSLADGGRQHLNTEHLRQWQQTTAYFNGNLLLVEIIADPGASPTHLVSTHAWAGLKLDGLDGDRSICGPTDDRELSDDPRTGRGMPIGCTAWLIDDACNCFLTAGHCAEYVGDTDIVEFNVPLSDEYGNVQHPGPEDQYYVDPDSLQTNGGQGIGNDWAYFGCFANTETGLTAAEAQGDFFHLTLPPDPDDKHIRITGYGTVSDPIPPEWNQAQKTHVGPAWDFPGTTVQYTTDTTGGNSGSPVILEETGDAIGIHTHGGCGYDGYNSGTGANHAGLQDALANPQGICIPSAPLDFEYPDGLPDMILPAGGTIRVVVSGQNGGVPEPGTGMLHFDDGGGWESLPMNQVQDNIYDAVFPALDCGVAVYYYFSAETTDSQIVTDPMTAPSHFFETVTGYGYYYAVNEFLDSNPGWDTTGEWAFGMPTGGGGDTHGFPDPTSGATGSNVYGVNLSGDYSLSPGGPYYLATHPLDCSEMAQCELHFQRWLNTDYQPYVFATVEISSDGYNWTMLWQNGSSEIADSSWQPMEYDISTIADGEPAVYLRWGYEVGTGAWAYSGWNIDDVQIRSVDCSSVPGDVNDDGVVDINDIFAILAAWGPCPGCPEDVTIDGTVDIDDVFFVLGNWS